MKKLYLLMVLSVVSVNSQTISFSDLNLKTALVNSGFLFGNCYDSENNALVLDANRDGQIQVSEARQVYTLFLDEMNISNLSGMEFFTNLRGFTCADNNISNINLSLPFLTSLGCYNNNLNSLNVSGCTQLQGLYCYNNNLTSLNLTGLSGLQALYCQDNQLQTLTMTGLSELLDFDCTNNQLTTLDISDCTNLFGALCSNNNLTNIDVNGLVNLNLLYVDYNQLTAINVDGLVLLGTLNANNNRITNFQTNGNPYLWANLQDNDLRTIICRDGFFQGISIGGNPNLQSICCDPIEEQGYQNAVIEMGLVNCNVNSYCSFESLGSHFTNNTAYTFDGNNNGCDGNDLQLSLGVKLEVARETVIPKEYFVNATATDVFVESNYTINPKLEVPAYFTVSPQNAIYNYPASSVFSQQFCITPNGSHSDIEVILLPLTAANQGDEAKYKLVFRNKGTNSLSGTVSLAFDDNLTSFVSAVPSVSAQSVNGLEWNYSNLKPFDSREITLILNVNASTEIPSVNPGTRLNFTASVTPLDEMAADNNFVYEQTVVELPATNDKLCLSGATVLPSFAGNYAFYIIRFENTGNIIAENVAIRDMIDTNVFDITTLIPISASHPYLMRITETNKTEFLFKNINLPFDDASNDGYIAFKIKTHPWLGLGASFSNKAQIYFTFDNSVRTNTASTQIRNSLSVADYDFNDYFTIYPNPAENVLNILIKNKVSVKSINIYNPIGQLMLSISNASGISVIDVSDLKTGNYFLKINSDKGSTNAKFVKN